MTPQPPLTPFQDESLPGYLPTEDEKTWALVVHLGAIVSSIVLPLVVLLTKGNESRWVRLQALEALNFHLTILLGMLLSVPLAMVFIGFCTMGALLVASLVLSIIGAVKAYGGEAYRYPVAVRLIK